MQIFIAALIGGLLQVVASLVGRVLLALGIGYAAYSGLATLINWAKTQAIANFGQLSATTIGVLSTMKVDVAISIVFSAIGVRLVIRGLSSDTIKRFILK